MLLTPLQSYFAAFYILEKATHVPEQQFLSTPFEYLFNFAPECEGEWISTKPKTTQDYISNDPGYLGSWYKALSEILKRKGPKDVERNPGECLLTPEQMLAALVMHLHEYSQYFVGLDIIMEDINRERISGYRDSEFWNLVTTCCEKAKQKLADDFNPGRRLYH
jgi:hypothetical protein